MTAFLPGLILALAVWIIPLLFRFLPARWIDRAAPRFPSISEWAPWIHSLGLPYAGLVAGWISARDYGLMGQTLGQWGLGTAAAILLGLLLGRVSVRFASARDWGDVRAEARWSLYRAAAWPWLNFLSLAVAVGLLASSVEYAFGGKRDTGRWSPQAAVPFLVRTAGSSLLFFLTHNFFLAMLYYLTAYGAAGRRFQSWIDRMRPRIDAVRNKLLPP